MFADAREYYSSEGGYKKIMWNASLFIAGSKLPLILSFKHQKGERLTILTRKYRSWQNAIAHFKKERSVSLKKAHSQHNTSESKEATVRECRVSTLVLKNSPCPVTSRFIPG